MANLSCHISRKFDAKLTEAANDRRLDLVEPYTKSGIISEALKDLLETNAEPDVQRPRNTSDRVSRNFQVKDALKRKLVRKVNAVKMKSNISHYAAFGGWIELALERWLTDNATKQKRRETSGKRE